MATTPYRVGIPPRGPSPREDGGVSMPSTLTASGPGPTDSCGWCDRPGPLVASYWGERLCPPCCLRACSRFDVEGWPPWPTTTEGPAEAGPSVSDRVDAAARSPHYTLSGTKHGIVTRRERRRHSERRSTFVEVPADAAALLDRHGADGDRLYLVGDIPGFGLDGLRSWAMPEQLPAGWAHDRHYLELPAPVLRYRHDDGRAVEVHRAAAWFGELDVTPAVAGDALALVDELVAGAFDEGRLLSTPASTGRYLLMRTVPFNREWPVLTDELQELIRSTSGQGRIELIDHDIDELAALVELDGRLMYAALCWGLAGGGVHHDHTDRFEGYTRARYRVRFRVPDDWRHVGLLAVMDEGGGWRWPRQPGETAETWCDGAELQVALARRWPVTIRERLLWPDTPNRGPLDAWAEKLREIRASIDGESFTAKDSPPPAVAAAARAAVRAIILHGIGALHGRPHKLSRVVPIADAAQVPPHARPTLRREGDWLIWAEGSDAAWPEMSHPEWSAAIWARARTRLLTGPGDAGALHLPYRDVVAFRTDAIYTTVDPHWPDDGAAGRYRTKRTVAGPLPYPTNHTELLQLRAKGDAT